MKENATKQTKRTNVIIVAATVIAAVGYFVAYFTPELGAWNAGALGLSVLAIAYFTSALAFTASVLFSVIAFFTAMPVIGYVYVAVIYTVSKTIQWILRFIFNQVLYRIPLYRSVEKKFKANSIVLGTYDAVNKIMVKAGLKEYLTLSVLEMRMCPFCGEDTPAGGNYCFACGNKLK
ncbi:Uncharacterised protein [uncultured archaeon]|nr:Uncharacterised protein [uncultured archaeon]